MLKPTMDSHATSDRTLRSAVEELELQVRRLGSRLDALEASQQSPGREPHSSPANAPIITEELVAAISAAIAAYLGVKPQIRQIRLVSGAAWAQQGRVTIQASHTLAVRHD